jgi:DNA-binding NarL/FixJ family response regulator
MSTTTPTVVLVDDYDKIRNLFRRVLERDHEFVVVGEAPDGRSGVEMVRALQPDLVLLDLSMPTMDGLEALREMRALAPSTRIAILSGFKEDVLGPLVTKMGATAYIEKGIKPDALAPRLRDALNAVNPPLRDLDPETLRRFHELI